MKIRDANAADAAAWRALWDGYTSFYRVALPEAVTAETWRRILDPASALTARVVEDEAGSLAGFAISFLQPGTFVTEPVLLPRGSVSWRRRTAAGASGGS